jgi:hypothetical protein
MNLSDIDIFNNRDNFVTKSIKSDDPLFGRTYQKIAEDFEKNNNEYSSVKVVNIEMVENIFVWFMFVLKNTELAIIYKEKHTEYHMFHGTKIGNIYSICCNNFDWRNSSRNASNKFGKGVAFSKKVSNASHYSDCINGLQKMIIARVIVCETNVGHENMELPLEGSDTSSNENASVVIKYDDNTFYPQYIITYSGEFVKKPARLEPRAHY